MKKLTIDVEPHWHEAPAWDFGVPGVALFRRPLDAKAAWNIVHLPSGLAIVEGYRTRDDALRAFLVYPPLDWTQGKDAIVKALATEEGSAE